MMRSRSFNYLLSKLDIHPVLIDIGAAVAPSMIWRPIASHSVYVGFDPDLRGLRSETQGIYCRSIIVNEAVTHDQGSSDSLFFFTKSPTCSSTLRPDLHSLSEYLFSDLFAVKREGKVLASTLDSVMERLDLPCIDWFKTDSQGTDLRLFESLRPEVQSKVLAVDMEPGLINAYVGEDLFINAHKALMESGFWLSNLEVQGTARMKVATLDQVLAADRSLTRQNVERAVRGSPGWVNARYLRTIPSLAQGQSGKREYVLLWIFSSLDDQLGFAADIAFEYERRFGEDTVCRMMKTDVFAEFKRRGRRLRTVREIVKPLIPTPVKQWIKKVLPAQFRGNV
jgi:hypothetical protein